MKGGFRMRALWKRFSLLFLLLLLIVTGAVALPGT